MSRSRLRGLTAVTGGALLVSGFGAVVSTSSAAAAPPDYRVVASGLNNPRHLTFTPGGDLLVAESGTGGDGPCIVSSEGSQVCSGPTGSITKITHGRHGWQQSRVVTGLPSLAGTVDDPATGAMKGGSATGPSDVDVLFGHRYVVSVGLGAPPSARNRGAATESAESSTPATLPKGFGTLLLTDSSHGRFSWWKHGSGDRFRVLADIAKHEQRTNPVDEPDSNPASLLRVGGRYLVADAGGNTVVAASLFGHVSTVATFPDQMVPGPGGALMPMQAVPTSVARYHGQLYVSQLTGFPFPQGGSTIWRIDRHGHPVAYATGLTNVTDLAFARDGSLYAVEISTAGLASGGPPIGALVRIPRGGGEARVVAGGLFAPYGVALRGHAAYVTTGSVLPGGGQVVRIPLH